MRNTAVALPDLETRSCKTGPWVELMALDSARSDHMTRGKLLNLTVPQVLCYNTGKLTIPTS